MMNSAETQQPSGTHRVDGRLHLIYHVPDDEGNLITTVTGPLKVEFPPEDLASSRPVLA